MKYIKYVKYIIVFILGIISGSNIMNYYNKKELKKIKIENTKNIQILTFLNNWLIMYQMKKNMVPYIEYMNYKNIAIYGMGVLGQRLYDELEGTSVNVAYAIDQNAVNIRDLVDIKCPSDVLEEVDAVIVTSLYYYEEIKQAMKKKMNCPVISISDCLAPEFSKLA